MSSFAMDRWLNAEKYDEDWCDEKLETDTTKSSKSSPSSSSPSIKSSVERKSLTIEIPEFDLDGKSQNKKQIRNYKANGDDKSKKKLRLTSLNLNRNSHRINISLSYNVVSAKVDPINLKSQTIENEKSKISYYSMMGTIFTLRRCFLSLF